MSVLHRSQRPCDRYHPEFLLHGKGSVVWTPRTWTCHSYQRQTDLHRYQTCENVGCRQLHRPGREHSELVAFRMWITSVHPAQWFSIYSALFIGRHPTHWPLGIRCRQTLYTGGALGSDPNAPDCTNSCVWCTTDQRPRPRPYRT